MTAAHVLVPVKALGLAKSRLAPALSPADRAALVLAMLEDTLAAALSAGDITVTVITADPDVAATSRRIGAHVLPDRVVPTCGDPLNSALATAAQHVRADAPGVDLIALQADLPALLPSELARALEFARRSDLAVVADHTGDGTTALLHCRPDSLPPLLFGPDSARRHRDAGAHLVPDALPGLRLDVDTPADLVAAARLGVGEATAALLGDIGFRVAGVARRDVTVRSL